MGDQRKGRYSERWPQKPTYGVPASPWLRTGYIITITKPPDAYWIAIATKSRMELRYQRSSSVGTDSAKGHWVSGPAKMEISLTTMASS